MLGGPADWGGALPQYSPNHGKKVAAAHTLFLVAQGAGLVPSREDSRGMVCLVKATSPVARGRVVIVKTGGPLGSAASQHGRAIAAACAAAQPKGGAAALAQSRVEQLSFSNVGVDMR